MKRIAVIISVILCFSCALCSCAKIGGGKKPEIETQNVDVPKTVIGSGDIEFIYEYTDAEGKLSSFLISTNESNLASALQNYALASFTQGENGDVTVINGFTLEEGAYWKFYVNGNSSKSSPSETKIQPGNVYSFVYTK